MSEGYSYEDNAATRELFESATVDDEASRLAMRMWETGMAEPDGPADSDPMEAL